MAPSMTKWSTSRIIALVGSSRHAVGHKPIKQPEFKNYEGKQQGFAPGGQVCRNGIVWDTGLVEIFRRKNGESSRLAIRGFRACLQLGCLARGYAKSLCRLYIE
jgi:hypothetical protein